MLMSEAVMVALITGAFGFLGNWILNNKNSGIIQEKISQLENKVEKHNQVVERTYRIEKDLDVAFERIRTNTSDIEEVREYAIHIENKHDADIDKLEEQVK